MTKPHPPRPNLNNGMTCPICGAQTSIYETRSNKLVVIRRRVCTLNRYHRFVTKEDWFDLQNEGLAHYLQRMIQEMNDDDD